MPSLVAGWLMFWCLLWLCWATGAPVVAEAAREPVRADAVCPYLVITHGIGSDLRTYAKVRDLCAE